MFNLRVQYILLLVLSLLFSGCFRDQDEELIRSIDFLELERRSPVEFERGEEKTVSDMSPNDVILAVNGYPLTKRAFDIVKVMKAESFLAHPKVDPQSVRQRVDEFAPRYPKMFMAQRLMVDHSFKIGLVSTNEVVESVIKAVKAAAKRDKTTVKGILSRYKGKERYYLYELAVSYIMDKLISERIPPRLEVTPEFVSNVQETVRLENIAGKATNALYRVELENVRKMILEGKISFEDAADKYSKVDDGDTELDKGGAWGEFEIDDFDDKSTAAKVFSMKEGEMSHAVEDENGVQIIKVVKIIPAEKNEEGVTTVNEKRVLAHIYKSKVPMLLTESDIQVTKDMKYQMRMQAVDRYVMNLVTNGENRVEYPHGRILFK